MNKYLEFILALTFFTISLIPITIFFILLFTSELYRRIIQLQLNNKHKSKVQLLNATDALFALPEHINEVTNNAIMIFEGKIKLEQLKTALKTTWTTAHPKLRSSIAKYGGYFYWKTETEFELDKHVELHDCEPPKNDLEFNEVVSDICNQSLPSDISPWKIYAFRLSNEYDKKSGKPHYALIMRFHHCISDGFGALLMTGRLFFDKNNVKVKIPTVSFLDRVLSTLAAILYCPFFIVLLLYNRDKNILHGPKQSGSRFTRFSNSFALGRVKNVGKSTGTTVNDVLTTCVESALRKLYFKLGGSIDGPIHAYVPISLHKPTDKLEFTNKSSSLLIPMGIDKDYEIVERLGKVKREITDQKTSCFYLSGLLLLKLSLNRMPESLTRLVREIVNGTLVVTNLAGWENECRSTFGDVLKFCAAFPTHMFDQALGVAITSFNGKIRLTMSVDKCIIDNVKTVDWFLSTCVEELEELEKSVGNTVNGLLM